MRLVLIALALLGCAELAVMALAASPPGADPNSPIYKWFDRQTNMLGGGCCGQGDGHTLEDNQWRITGTDYEVSIGDAWYRISRTEFLLHAADDPNPTHKAVVWYSYDRFEGGRNGVKIYCFAPGWSS